MDGMENFNAGLSVAQADDLKRRIYDLSRTNSRLEEEKERFRYERNRLRDALRQIRDLERGCLGKSEIVCYEKVESIIDMALKTDDGAS